MSYIIIIIGSMYNNCGMFWLQSYACECNNCFTCNYHAQGDQKEHIRTQTHWSGEWGNISRRCSNIHWYQSTATDKFPGGLDYHTMFWGIVSIIATRVLEFWLCHQENLGNNGLQTISDMCSKQALQSMFEIRYSYDFSLWLTEN